jgi:hypothetical protein
MSDEATASVTPRRFEHWTTESGCSRDSYGAVTFAEVN